jgi:tetratricopeptide (TPR) repeat protein
VTEANRLAELSVQTSPDLAAAHQALGAARHIALRLDDAEAEYARALALDPKSTAAKLALADLRRASGNGEAALTFYREVLQADPKSNSAQAGVVLSLLELGKKPEAEQEITAALQNPEKARNLPLLVGAGYWYLAHNDPVPRSGVDSAGGGDRAAILLGANWIRARAHCRSADARSRTRGAVRA